MRSSAKAWARGPDSPRRSGEGHGHVLDVPGERQELLAVVLDQPVPGLDRLGDLCAPAVILRHLPQVVAEPLADRGLQPVLNGLELAEPGLDRSLGVQDRLHRGLKDFPLLLRGEDSERGASLRDLLFLRNQPLQRILQCVSTKVQVGLVPQ
jgi:hypothetical protein